MSMTLCDFSLLSQGRFEAAKNTRPASSVMGGCPWVRVLGVIDFVDSDELTASTSRQRVDELR